MTTITELPTEYGTMRRRLDAAGAKMRAASLLAAAARGAAVVGPLTACVLFTAGTAPMPGWAKGGLLALWATGAMWAYARWLHRAVFRRPSYAEIARALEEGLPVADHPPHHNALTNAVLLAEELEAGVGGGEGAHPWAPHVVREAAAAADSLPLDEAITWREPRRAWLAALAVLVPVAAWAAWMPGPFAHGWAVLTNPSRYVPRQGAVRIVSVLPGNDTAIAGQLLNFSVTLAVAADQKALPVTLTLRAKSGKVSTLPMLPFGSSDTGPDGGGERQFTRAGILAAEDLDYQVLAGDTESDRFHIAVVPQLHLVTYAVAVTPPAYTGQPASEVALAGKDATAAKGSVDAPAGSAVRLAVTLDAPAKEVLLDGPDGPQPLTPAADGRTFSAAWPLKESRSFSLRVNDGAIRTLRQFPDADDGAAPQGPRGNYTLTAVPDMPPAVAAAEPARDTDGKPGGKLAVAGQASDDYGLHEVRLEIAKNADKDFHVAQTWPAGSGTDGRPSRAVTVRGTLDFADLRLGDTLRYRFVAVDNRDLTALDPALGPQTTAGQVFTITFSDTAAAAAAAGKRWDELRQQLAALLARQVALRQSANVLVPTLAAADIRKAAGPVVDGQKSLRADMDTLAKAFPFEPPMKVIQKALQVLVVEDATAAVDRGTDVLLLSDGRALPPLAAKLKQHQNRIIDVLQALLAVVQREEDRLARAAQQTGGDPPADPREAWRQMAEDLKAFAKEQKAVIDATADLAKKPKDQFGADDDKKLKDLAAVEDKWEKFLNNRLADLSKIAEQDQANASLLEELVQMKIELAAAKDALDKKAAEIATPLEQNGLENAEQLTTHLERWLQQQPDRQAWQMEEPVTQNDPKMAELPKQLQDMVGDLMDKEEDLTDEMESLASKYADSMDKGAGWDTADGPISNMSAQGVTGNQMPKDMEIQGRSGEGREGRSSGEMVGAVAEGKEGRRTPTRMTNEPFSQSQVEDRSKLPANGATGGGKKAGLASEGLEGPGPQEQSQITQRLAGQQAQLRNEAERLALQMHAAQFDNFKLIESNAYLKKSEDALKQFHYQTALYYQEQAVQSLNTAKVLAAGQMHVVADTSPKAGEQVRKDVEAALNGPLPKGYSEGVKAYFERLAGGDEKP